MKLFQKVILHIKNVNHLI